MDSAPGFMSIIVPCFLSTCLCIRNKCFISLSATEANGRSIPLGSREQVLTLPLWVWTLWLWVNHWSSFLLSFSSVEEGTWYFPHPIHPKLCLWWGGKQCLLSCTCQHHLRALDTTCVWLRWTWWLAERRATRVLLCKRGCPPDCRCSWRCLRDCGKPRGSCERFWNAPQLSSHWTSRVEARQLTQTVISLLSFILGARKPQCLASAF